jgi:hypothetical protein
MEQQQQQQHPFHDFAHIKEIDFAGNLLCDWVQVWTIMNQFPNLEHFSIAYNYVRDINDREQQQLLQPNNDNHSLFLSTGMTTTLTTGTITLLRFCNHDRDSLPMDLEDDDKMLNY